MLHIALQPQPVIHGRSLARTACHQELVAIKAGLDAAGALPPSLTARLSDASLTVLSELHAGVDALIWLGMGMGWEADAGTLSTSALVQAIAEQPTPPSLVVVALKYGGEACASALLRAGVDTVVWLQSGCVLTKVTPLVLQALVPCVCSLLESGAAENHSIDGSGLSTGQAEQQLLQAAQGVLGASWPRLAGCMRRVDARVPRPVPLRPAPVGGRVELQLDGVAFCGRTTSRADASGAAHADAGLHGLALLTADLCALEEVVSHLRADAPPALIAISERAAAGSEMSRTCHDMSQAGHEDAPLVEGAAAEADVSMAGTNEPGDGVMASGGVERSQALALEVCTSLAGEEGYDWLRSTNVTELAAAVAAHRAARSPAWRNGVHASDALGEESGAALCEASGKAAPAEEPPRLLCWLHLPAGTKPDEELAADLVAVLCDGAARAHVLLTADEDDEQHDTERLSALVAASLPPSLSCYQARLPPLSAGEVGVRADALHEEIRLSECSPEPPKRPRCPSAHAAQAPECLPRRQAPECLPRRQAPIKDSSPACHQHNVRGGRAVYCVPHSVA